MTPSKIDYTQTLRVKSMDRKNVAKFSKRYKKIRFDFKKWKLYKERKHL